MKKIIKKLLQFLKDCFTMHEGDPMEAFKKPKKSKPHKTIKKHYLQIDVKRKWFTKKSTIGKLYLDGEYQCYTLEDRIRNEKVYGETAISAGSYRVKLNYSPRFKTVLPLLINVPEFKGIRIHPGNTSKDTDGCILVGETRSKNFIGRSRTAFKKLFKKIEQAQKDKKEIIINID